MYAYRTGVVYSPWWQNPDPLLPWDSPSSGESGKGLFATVLLAVDPRTSTPRLVAALLASVERIVRVNRARIMFSDNTSNMRKNVFKVRYVEFIGLFCQSYR